MRVTRLAAMFVAGVLVAVGLPSAHATPRLMAGAKPPTCHGEKATIAKHRGTVVGTPGRDVIVLTGRATVRARGGHDLICGSPRRDTISGGAGRDHIYAGGGHDRVRGGAGRDRVMGDAGRDRLSGGSGVDHMYGGPGTDAAADVSSVDSYIEASGYLLDLQFTAAGLNALYQSGQAVGLVRASRTTGAPGQPVLLSVLYPRADNEVYLWELTGAYYSSPSLNGPVPPLAPGSQVQSAGVSGTMTGSILPLTPQGFEGSESGGPAGAVTVMAGQGVLPGYLGAVGMVALNGDNDQSMLAPISVTEVVAGQTVGFEVEDELQLLTVPAGAAPGEVLSAGDLAGALSVAFSPQQSTRTATYAGDGAFRLED